MSHPAGSFDPRRIECGTAIGDVVVVALFSRSEVGAALPAEPQLPPSSDSATAVAHTGESDGSPPASTDAPTDGEEQNNLNHSPI